MNDLILALRAALGRPGDFAWSDGAAALAKVRQVSPQDAALLVDTSRPDPPVSWWMDHLGLAPHNRASLQSRRVRALWRFLLLYHDVAPAIGPLPPGPRCAWDGGVPPSWLLRRVIELRWLSAPAPDATRARREMARLHPPEMTQPVFDLIHAAAVERCFEVLGGRVASAGHFGVAAPPAWLERWIPAGRRALSSAAQQRIVQGRGTGTDEAMGNIARLLGSGQHERVSRIHLGEEVWRALAQPGPTVLDRADGGALSPAGCALAHLLVCEGTSPSCRSVFREAVAHCCPPVRAGRSTVDVQGDAAGCPPGVTVGSARARSASGDGSSAAFVIGHGEEFTLRVQNLSDRTWEIALLADDDDARTGYVSLTGGGGDAGAWGAVSPGSAVTIQLDGLGVGLHPLCLLAREQGATDAGAPDEWTALPAGITGAAVFAWVEPRP